METRKIVVISLATTLLLLPILYAFSPLLYSVVLKSYVNVNVKTIGCEVYSDANCTKPLTEIKWGTFDPGGSNSTFIYLKSTSNINITLDFYTQNWNPQNVKNYITLTTDYKNSTQISPNEVIKIKLTLKISYSIEGITTFSFDIVITASEVEVVPLQVGPYSYNLTPTDDSWICGTYSYEVVKNFGSNYFLTVGRDPIGPYRGLIMFNISAYTSKTITSALLKLYYFNYHKNYDNPVGREISLYKNLQSWTESTVTFSTAPPFDKKVSSLLTPNSFGWITFDVTSDIKSSPYGWTIKFTDETSSSLLYLNSKESLYIPHLTITTSD